MQQINCDINHCLHNKSSICYSSRVHIGGVNVSSKRGTWCDSFLDGNLHNNVTNNANCNSQCYSLTCEVENCSNNSNNRCNLQYIEVSGTKSPIYAQTKCSSFYFK